MSVPTSTVTVVLANRPRLFRELLQHALNTASPQFEVIEVADAAPAASVLRDAHWIVVDEDSATAVAKMSVNHPHLGILALEGRGSRARVLAPAEHAAEWQQLSDVPTLSTLFELLSQVPARQSKKLAQ
ncbi:MAG: hypothetical protein IT328_25135 [Caldilineaceae bacterium]|nr:hypothetical protein [Caldilineaceae bacterium]